MTIVQKTDDIGNIFVRGLDTLDQTFDTIIDVDRAEIPFSEAEKHHNLYGDILSPL